MNTNNIQNADRVMRRTAIERIIAHYPNVPADDLRDVLHYFGQEASALERATIASNEKIYSQYRKLCDDHRLDRLRPFEIAIAVAVGVALIGALAVLSILY